MAEEAKRMIDSIFDELVDNILRNAPNARTSTEGKDNWKRKIRLGNGRLEFGILWNYFEASIIQGKLYPMGYKLGSYQWDILAGGYIEVAENMYGYNVASKSANLWFGKLVEGDDYRWWEVSYMYPKSTSKEHKRYTEPFGFTDIPSFFGSEFTYLLVEDPKPITHEYVDEFIERWVDIFAFASVMNNQNKRQRFPLEVVTRPISPKFNFGWSLKS
jgi:hypothetical protein